MEDEKDSVGRFDRHAQALAAGLGALAALPFGPAGPVVGATLGPLLVPVAEQVFREVNMDGRRRSGEALAATCDASGLSAEETVTRALSDEKSRLLSANAIIAATHTAWEDKVRTLGRSLASGLLAADDAQIDSEQLIMAAIADMEAPHLALLDLLVAWRPPRRHAEGITEMMRINNLDATQSQPFEPKWANRDKWHVWAIQKYRPRFIPVLSSLVGTFQRHGLADNVVDADGPAVASTELGEHVWLRFYKAGARVPEIWTAPAPSTEVKASNLHPM